MKTIAIIDDDAAIGDMLQEVLQAEGYGVLRAYSGTEALYLLSETQPGSAFVGFNAAGTFRRRGACTAERDSGHHLKRQGRCKG